MPQRKQPHSLETLALRAVGIWVKCIGKNLVDPVCWIFQRDCNEGVVLLQKSIVSINETLYASVPWYLFDKMAVQVLTSVNDLIQETKAAYDQFVPMSLFLSRMKVVVSLTEVVVHSHLKHLDISHWPKIMRHVLNQNLHRLEGLEELNLGSGSGGWDTSEAEKSILSGVRSMSNLTYLCLCFDCTDHILSVVGANCPLIQILDVTSSRSVTDRSVPSLLNCNYLRELKLYRTSVSVEGFKTLLTSLPCVQDLGRCDDFGNILERVSEENLGPLGLKSLQSRDLRASHLRLMVKLCPYLTHVSIFHDEKIADLTLLSALDNLTELKLMNCDFFGDRIKNLLEARGTNLILLHLEHVEEIDLNAIIYISQYCPRLKTLTLINCEFGENNNLIHRKMKVPPFLHLERLICVADCALMHLQFLLSHCFNIRYIQLGSSTGIDDKTMIEVFTKNPMKHLEELKILYSYGLSMQTVDLLMTCCDKLRTLSELESWEGISAQELRDFRHYITTHNLDLDVRPTLSY
ncbi:uncharacterized protein LOC142319270 isoform X1 [Lycorma delicatula]|uniref:uncharacterized protein LOC142319270 isoform X1 n=1 Tax=Lycorma delicatula TaxID=130591 RepID=UPI003F518B5C